MTQRYFLIGAVVLALVLAGFFAVRTYASTGCFSDTNGLAAEPFICWMKEKGITSGCGSGNYCPNAYVTRAQMAVFMRQSAEVPPTTGNILVSAGYGSWHSLLSGDPITYQYFSDSVEITRTAIGTTTFSLHPAVPVAWYGKSLNLVGAEFCYETVSGNLLSAVSINVYTEISRPLSSNTPQFQDLTDRTDYACRYYALSTPVVMTPEKGVNLIIDVEWTTENTAFYVGRTTFVFQPTDTTAADVAALSGEDVTILQPAAQDSNRYGRP